MNHQSVHTALCGAPKPVHSTPNLETTKMRNYSILGTLVAALCVAPMITACGDDEDPGALFEPPEVAVNLVYSQDCENAEISPGLPFCNGTLSVTRRVLVPEGEGDDGVVNVDSRSVDLTRDNPTGTLPSYTVDAGQNAYLYFEYALDGEPLVLPEGYELQSCDGGPRPTEDRDVNLTSICLRFANTNAGVTNTAGPPSTGGTGGAGGTGGTGGEGGEAGGDTGGTGGDTGGTGGTEVVYTPDTNGNACFDIQSWDLNDATGCTITLSQVGDVTPVDDDDSVDPPANCSASNEYYVHGLTEGWYHVVFDCGDFGGGQTDIYVEADVDSNPEDDNRFPVTLAEPVAPGDLCVAMDGIPLEPPTTENPDADMADLSVYIGEGCGNGCCVLDDASDMTITAMEQIAGPGTCTALGDDGCEIEVDGLVVSVKPSPNGFDNFAENEQRVYVLTLEDETRLVYAYVDVVNEPFRTPAP
ncbi:hypothetical protein JXD20_01530 [Candidatus Peregrinibacteria bacterium]|nr:hypothetical protein [Candidatus Peregrinibacteria bacterium]